jgi:hypothetical protein
VGVFGLESAELAFFGVLLASHERKYMIQRRNIIICNEREIPEICEVRLH